MPEDSIGSYRKVRLPDTRLLSIDMLEATRRRQWIAGIIEVDITEARRALASPPPGQKSPSFTTWAVKCISQAASEHPEVHGARKGRKLVIFDDVDVTVIIESERRGKKVPRPYVIRKANEKSLEEISEEIEIFKTRSTDELVLGDRKGAAGGGHYLLFLPEFVRRLVLRLVTRRAFLMKKMGGTVVVTSLGMFGKASGWALPVGTLPLSIAIGSTSRKPGVVAEAIEIRDFLNLTLLFNHEAVDGAPATRFVSRLAELMESAHGLRSEL